jgi:hypothetical protein
MSSIAFRLYVALFCLLAVGPGRTAAAPPPGLPSFDSAKKPSPAELDERLKAVVVGLPPEQVRWCIGPPDHVCRQILYHRYLEQWIYDTTFTVRLEFDCPRGQEPRLQSVQPPAAPGD